MVNGKLQLAADRRLMVIAGFIILLLLALLSWRALSVKKKTPVQTKPCYKKTITLWAPLERKTVPLLNRQLKGFCLSLDLKTKSTIQITQELLEAVAAGQEPDIVYADADFLSKYANIFSPPPPSQASSFALADYPQAIKTIFEFKSPKQQRAGTASQKQVQASGFLAYPLTYDTLVLFFNRDLLNAAGKEQPPDTFEELTNTVSSLRRINADNQIVLSPIALGTAVNNPVYLETFLSLWKMLNPATPKISSDIARSLYQTLGFYTQFANSHSPFFSWHPNLPAVKEAFLQEKIAMMIDFYSTAKVLKTKNPRLNFALAPLPRFVASPKKANYLQPYFLAATKKNPEISWLLIQLIDQDYENFMAKFELKPIKIKVAEKAASRQPEEKILFEELLVGDSFIALDKEFLKEALKVDIENWIANEKDVRRLIADKQASKFFKR